MKTLEQIAKEYKSECLDKRDLTRLSNFIPFNMLEGFGIKPSDEFNSPEKWNADVKEFTRENVLKQLEKDVAFGFEKALDKRGISAALMFQVVQMWNWILEEGLENWSNSHYAQYGLPLFKATAVKYGFDNPIGDDVGDESKYAAEEW